jgi:hypothetical protein
MGDRNNVAIAVTNEVDRLLRNTMKSLAHGDQSVALLDQMHVADKNGWRLYHREYIDWHRGRPECRNIDEFLRNLVYDIDVEYEKQIQMVKLSDYLPDDIADTLGGSEDPFGLGYELTVTYDKD